MSPAVEAAQEYALQVLRTGGHAASGRGEYGLAYRMHHAESIAPHWKYGDFLIAVGLGHLPLATDFAGSGATTVYSGELRVTCGPGDAWAAVLVLASLALKEPPVELSAIASVLLADGWATIVRGPA